MKIPYGDADFARIRRESFFYADKTSFLPVLEGLPRFLVFLRPRRFGKSLLVSVLEHYYDIARKDQFDALFQGLWVHQHPTPEQGRYLILRFDFSGVSTDGDEDHVRASFGGVVRNGARGFVARYRDRIPSLDALLPEFASTQEAEAIVGALLAAVAAANQVTYVLIDEYDHFANRLLSRGDERLYEAIIKKTGFARTFYAALKTGTAIGAVSRMFVTGVSPLMLDDMSSGFNIASHVSLDPGLATLAGFTREETERAAELFLAARPHLATVPAVGNREALVDLLERSYDGYRFSSFDVPRVFNPDMVLYLLHQIDRLGTLPSSLLDMNVRTEYSHLQRIGTLSGAEASERSALLLTLAGEGKVRSPLVERFGIDALASRAPFLSLLFHLGMLTLGPAAPSAEGHLLEVPNRVIRELQWEHLTLMLRSEHHVRVHGDDLRSALAALVERGDIGPFLDLFRSDVLQAMSERDTRGLDEKTIKLLLMVYASFGHVFTVLSEKELAQGYCDLFLSAARNLAGAKFSWLLELKNLKANAKSSEIEAAFAKAEAQVKLYSSDRTLLPLLLGGDSGGQKRLLRSGMLVFVGAKRALFRPFGEGMPHEAALGRQGPSTHGDPKASRRLRPKPASKTAPKTKAKKPLRKAVRSEAPKRSGRLRGRKA